MFSQRYTQTKSGKLSKTGKPLVAAEVAHLWSEASAEHAAAADRPRD